MKANTTPLPESVTFKDHSGASVVRSIKRPEAKVADGKLSQQVSEKPSEKSLNDLLARFSK